MANQTLAQTAHNTRLGFHYFPDEAHYRELDLQAWLPELNALGAGWLTLTASLNKAVPESFLQGLMQAGIEPIVHIAAGPIRRLETGLLRSLLQAYARWGVRYVSVFSEPNSRSSWAPADWGKTALVERALDAILPTLQLQSELGLVPLFPPLKPGGDYWDTAFLDMALEGLIRRASPSLIGRMAFGIHAYTRNRPLDWGAGGPARWTQTRPYITPPGAEDNLGFRIGDWYDALIQKRLGVSLPLVCLAGGPVLGDASDPNFPALDESRHEACTLEIVRELATRETLGPVLNTNFWLLAADGGHPAVDQAWYRPDGQTLPVVNALKAMRTAASQKGLDETAVRPGVTADMCCNPDVIGKDGRGLHHYVLLPTYEWGVPDWHWNAVREYVKAFRPACGFSPEEAREARFVTIVGNEQGIPSEVERALVHAGCKVDRIDGPDGTAIEAQLNRLAHCGQRFTHGA